MDNPKFKDHQKVSFIKEISDQIGQKEAHIVKVYSQSQMRKFNADYRVVLQNSTEVDVKESDIVAV